MNNEKIEIILGSTKITIVLNNLGWDSFISNFEESKKKKKAVAKKKSSTNLELFMSTA